MKVGGGFTCSSKNLPSTSWPDSKGTDQLCNGIQLSTQLEAVPYASPQLNFRLTPRETVRAEKHTLQAHYVNTTVRAETESSWSGTYVESGDKQRKPLVHLLDPGGAYAEIHFRTKLTRSIYQLNSARMIYFYVDYILITCFLISNKTEGNYNHAMNLP